MARCQLQHCGSTESGPTELSVDLTALLQASGPDNVLVVGRTESEADICLASETLPLLISRRQAKLSLSNGQLRVTDTSTNGTHVNTAGSGWTRLPRGQPQALLEGDLLAFGGGRTVYRDSTVRNGLL